MMSGEISLARKVEEALQMAEKSGVEPVFSPALAEAMRLADVFSYVVPQQDNLPLDALAGFPITASKNNPYFSVL